MPELLQKAAWRLRFLVFLAGIAAMPACCCRAQCPPNIDFSFGNFSKWSCDTGQASATAGAWPVFSPGGLSGPVANRHSLTSGPGVDKYGGFPVVAPGGGPYSIKLGNDGAGAQAERMRYFIQVPPGYNNYSLQYRYAAVLEAPAGSAGGTRPAFQIEAIDSATQMPVNNGCSGQTLVVGGAGPGFQQSTVAPFPKYIPWTSGTLNLSGQGGRTIIIQITSFDGTAGGHFGYGYFDIISCGTFEAAITSCNLDQGFASLEAPPGYASYAWYRGPASGMPFSTTRGINLSPVPAVPTVYYCVATPYSGQGCSDTLESKSMSDFSMRISPHVICQNYGPALLSVTASGGSNVFSYNWLPSNGLYVIDPFSGILDSSHAVAIVGVGPLSVSHFICGVWDMVGCYRSDTAWLQAPAYRARIGQDTTICLGSAIALRPRMYPAGTGYKFTWSPGSALSDSTVQNPTYRPVEAGNEALALRVDSGYCSVVDSIHIRTLPDTFRTVDTAVCKGETFKAGVFTDPRFQDSLSYTWLPASGLTLGGNNRRPTIWADSSISYTVTMSYPGCPDVTRTLNVMVEPVPIVEIGADTLAKCFGTVLPLAASVLPAGYPGYTYTWRRNTGLDSTGVPQVHFSGNEDTTLVLTVRTPLGCRGADSVYIDARPLRFAHVTPGDTAVCPNDEVRMQAGGGVSYRWTPGLFLNDSSSAAVTARPVSPVDYLVFVKDDIGCADTLSVSLWVHEGAFVKLPDSIVLNWGESIRMNPVGNGAYFEWSPPGGLSDPHIADPIAAPDESRRYILSVKTDAGCAATDSIYVLVNSALFLPNAFAPGDGINPEFRILHTGIQALQSFRIYNRWGNLVFSTTDINKGWDGSYKGQPQPMDVYVYTVEAIGTRGKVLRKNGNVTLIR